MPWKKGRIGFPQIGSAPIDGWFIKENPIKMNDLEGNPHFRKSSVMERETIATELAAQKVIKIVQLPYPHIQQYTCGNDSHPAEVCTSRERGAAGR